MGRPALLLAGVLATLTRPAAAQDTLTVVTLNLWHDQGDWPARLVWMTAELAALRPDVVFLQEVLQHETLPNQAETLAGVLGLSHVLFASVDSAGRQRRYGNAILSHLPYVESGERRLPPMDAYRIAAWARIDVGGRPVRLYATHLHNPEDADAAGVRATGDGPPPRPDAGHARRRRPVRPGWRLQCAAGMAGDAADGALP